MSVDTGVLPELCSLPYRQLHAGLAEAQALTPARGPQPLPSNFDRPLP